MLHPETGIHFGREVDDLRNQLAALREENARLKARLVEMYERIIPEEIAKGLERLTRERDEALAFLRRASVGPREIVSTGRLTELEIANYRTAGLMYVEPGGGLGWVVRERRVLEMAEKERDDARAELRRFEETQRRPKDRSVEALEGLLNAWDRAEGGRGCYSCAELHDCRCELDRKISTVCTCGRVELDAAAETARAALASAKGGE